MSVIKKLSSSFYISEGYSRGMFSNFIQESIALPNEFISYLKEPKCNNKEFDELIKENSLLTINPLNIFSYDWDSFSHITNVLVEGKHSVQMVNSILEACLVQSITQIFGQGNLDLICENILRYSSCSLTSIDCVFFNQSNDEQALLENLNKLFSNPLIKTIILIGSSSKLSPMMDESQNFISYENDFFEFPKVDVLTSKELIHESQNHNPYFNRKLYIGSDGELKNAPECEEVYGNINLLKSGEELKQIVSTAEFQKYWHIKPDMIDVTKDNEFRYMSIDNRIPYQRQDGSWYHKEEPNYNPYIAKWKSEEGYKTLAECGVISNEKGFSIDHKKIEEINKELWGE